MKFTVVRSVKHPERAHNNDAGIDFFIPEINDKFLEDLTKKNTHTFIDNYYITTNSIILKGNSDILIPSGVCCILPEDSVLIAFNKSGVATQKKLTVGAEVVDEGYRGEIHIHFFNQSNSDVELKENSKIVQFLLFPIRYEELNYIDKNEFDTSTERGSNGFGSSGK